MSSTKFVVVKLKELIKTAVFAVLGIIILVGLIWFFLGLGQKDSATYRDGVYHAQMALGDERAMVSVTIAKGEIEDIALADLPETAQVFYPMLETAVDEVAREVVANQTLTIQVSEGNAYSAQVILEAVAEGLSQAQK